MSWFHIAELIGVALGTALYTYFRLKNKKEHKSHHNIAEDHERRIRELESHRKEVSDD